MSSVICRSSGVILTVVTLVLATVGFATDNWQVWRVHRPGIKAELSPNSSDETNFNSSYMYFTRHMGLFRVCYPDSETKELLEELVDGAGNCASMDYQLGEQKEDVSNKSMEYWLAIHVRRCLFGLMTVALFMLLCSLISGTFGCWTAYSTAASVTAVFLICAAVLLGASIATVYGLHYLEAYRVPEFQMTPLLAKYGQWSISWSMFLVCSSLAACCISSVVFESVWFSMYQIEIDNRAKQNSQRHHMRKTPYFSKSMNHHEARFNPSSQHRAQYTELRNQQNGAEKMVPIMMFSDGTFQTGDFEKGTLY